MQEEQSSFVWKNLIYNTISDVLQKWQIILLVGVVCAICYDAFVSFRYVPMYRSDATVAMDYLTASYDSSKADEIAETFTYILSSNVFKKNIEKSMGVESIDGYFEAKSYQGTSILYVSAYSPKASTSYAMMRAMMDNCEDILKLIVGNNEVEVLSGISLPMAPYNSLSHKRNLVVAGGAGVAVMTMLFAMLSFMKDTLKNKYEVEQKIHLPLYGALPIESKLISFKNLKRKKAILVTQYSTSFHYIETFKRIRSKIEKHAQKHKQKVFLITSTLENEGKSLVSVNTALTLAKNNHKVLLIDADFKKPSVHLILDDFNEHYGIEHILCDHMDFEDVVVPVKNYNLDVVYGYASRENVLNYVDSGKMHELVASLRDKYDYIIIDSAPSRFLPDTRLLSTLADGILFVVRQNFSLTSTILETIEKFNVTATPIIGCIFNRSLTEELRSYGYYGSKYGYGHYYGRKRKEEQ